MHDVMIYKKKNTPFMRSNAYTNCFEFMFVLSKGKPKKFNPLKEKTVRNGYEMLTYNKKPDGINKKNLKELKKQKTKNRSFCDCCVQCRRNYGETSRAAQKSKAKKSLKLGL